MIDKEYLDNLKKEDYIAWDNLVNDPIVLGEDTGSYFILIIIVLVLFVSLIVGVFL